MFFYIKIEENDTSDDDDGGDNPDAEIIMFIVIGVIVAIIINVSLICLWRFIKARRRIRRSSEGQVRVITTKPTFEDPQRKSLVDNDASKVDDGHGVANYDELDVWRENGDEYANPDNNDQHRGSNVIVQSTYNPVEGQNNVEVNLHFHDTNDGFNYPPPNNNKRASYHDGYL